MAYRFITAEQVETLPVDDNRRAFLAYEAVCQDSYNRLQSNLNGNDTGYRLRLALMGRIYEAALQYEIEGAQELDIENFTVHSFQDNSTSYDFETFEIALQRMIARLEIQVARESRDSSVILTPQAKLKIEHHIRAIRDRIADSNISDSKKKSLYKKLDELGEALEGKRLNLAKAMVIIASVFVTVEKGEEALIKLPDTMAAIQRLIGEGKELADNFLPPASQKRLTSSQSDNHGQTLSDLDDDIPF